MTEAQVERAILLALSKRTDVRLFKNEVGRAVDPGTGAYVQFGLCVGSSDLVGLVRHDPIAARMALSRIAAWLPPGRGLEADVAVVELALQLVARFLALEVKSATGRPTPAQSNFVAMVNAMGGVGRIVRSVDEALAAADEAARP